MTIFLIIWILLLVAIAVWTLVQYAGAQRLRARAQACMYWDFRMNMGNDLTFLDP